MLSRIRRLPSPALVISTIALIVAVGGGTAALALTDNQKDKKIAKKVSNKQITKRAPGLSVKHAKTAGTATTADTVAGMSVQKIFFKGPASTAATPQFTSHGLTLNLGCNASGDLIATVSSASSQVSLQGESSGDATPNGTPYSAGNTFTNQNIIGTNGFGSGRLTYSTLAGGVVTLVYGFDNPPTLGGQNVCTFRATAVSG